MLLLINGISIFFMLFQILEMNPEEEAEEDGANIDLDSQRKGKCVVLKTSTRQVKSLCKCISLSIFPTYPSFFLFSVFKVRIHTRKQASGRMN